MSGIRLTLQLVLLVFVQSLSAAEQIPQKLAPLRKLTVGPYDNYQSAFVGDAQDLYYTRNQNLASQIMRLDRRTGLTHEVTDAKADAKSPALSPDGKRVAFTYYKFDAKGDVCLKEAKGIRCLTGPQAAEHSAFFIDNATLAYLVSDDFNGESQLRIKPLDGGSEQVLLKGQIYSPSLAPDGQSIVYKGFGNDLIIYHLAQKKRLQSLPVELPGVTGPARFSVDGRYLYFAQYMLDSNRDLRLDGRDTAAIYRLALSDVKAVPEQLSSLQQNCSYPVPGADELYLTCAFEGALDIYRTALSGIVPTQWTADDLWAAHQTARSYADRILLINHLASRFGVLSKSEAAERSLSDFIFAGQWLPAIYYAEELTKTGHKSFRLQQLLLETRAHWDVLPRKENLGAFASFLAAQRLKIEAEPASSMQAISLAWLELFANQKQRALELAQKINSDEPLSLFWLTELFRLASPVGSTIYRQELSERLSQANLNSETRLYYLSRWLELLPREQNPAAALQPLQRQLAADKVLSDLLQHEQDLYDLVQAKTPAASIPLQRGISQRVIRLKDQYYAMRLLFNRGMLILYEAKKNRELNTIMSLWLSYVKPDSKEYPFVIEALKQNSLDLGYRFYHSSGPERDFAIGAFYDSIRSADDLESHFQYTLLNSSPAAFAELEKNYAAMRKDGLIRVESRDFVRIVHQLLGPKPPSLSELEEAATRLQAMSDDHIGVASRYLLLAYAYHAQLQLKQKDFAFDRDLADLAHRSYLLAIDAAHANERMRAGALQNLGLLHLQLRNNSLAAEFFEQRASLGYADQESKQAVLWFAAKAMYRAYRFQDALRMIETALALQPQHPAFLEKTAFYAWNAGDYKRADEVYQKLFAQMGESAPVSLYLSHGYVLSRLGQTKSAEAMLLRLIQAPQSRPKPDSSAKLAPQPDKIRFVAQGLLARLPLPIESKIAYLQLRLASFEAILSRAQEMQLKAETLSAQRIKETEELGLWQLEAGLDQAALLSLERSLELSMEFGARYGYLNHAVFVSLKNKLITLREHKLVANPGLAKKLQRLLDVGQKELEAEPKPVAELEQKWLEVQLQSLAYELRAEPEQFGERSRALLESPRALFIQKDRPALYGALRNYRAALQAYFLR